MLVTPGATQNPICGWLRLGNLRKRDEGSVRHRLPFDFGVGLFFHHQGTAGCIPCFHFARASHFGVTLFLTTTAIWFLNQDATHERSNRDSKESRELKALQPLKALTDLFLENDG